MISIQSAVPRNPAFRFKEPVSLTIGTGEHIAFVGPNGGGKSMLAKILTGACPLSGGDVFYDQSLTPVYEKVQFIAFRDSYGAADAHYYLQQRWNSQDREASPAVRDALGGLRGDELQQRLFGLFGIGDMLDKQMVLLSSGEMRKFRLTKAMLARPRALIIDKPFIGLDAQARAQLRDLLCSLAEMGGLQIMLLLAKTDEIPGFITHIVPVRDMLCGAKVRRCDYCEPAEEPPAVADLCPPGASAVEGGEGEPIVEMRDVSIRYGERIILDSLSWTVRRGEKWALLGRNGAGKSTLLSLVCADNPQSYACDIALFGRRRGSGESIWDIKRRIGYVSPEMHRAYSENLPAVEIVASGLHDSVGLYVRPRPEQFAVCEWWMDVFGIGGLRNRSFLQLSDGEQRLVLLARAFVKDPELLILDEPLHGLDTRNRRLVRAVIEAFCRRPKKTLVMVTHYDEELPECIGNRLVLKNPALG